MNIFPKNTYFYYFFIGMLSITTSVFGAPATTATISAYSVEIKLQKTPKLPVPNSNIQLDADLLLSDFAKTQSYVTVRKLENNELQNYLTRLQETARDLLKVRNSKKTIIDKTGIIFPGEETPAVIKTILRKSDSQLHVAITAYVHTTTDAAIIKAICNLCNALFPQLTFMQKHGAVMGTCAVIGLSVLGVSQKKWIQKEIPPAIRRSREYIKNKLLERHYLSFGTKIKSTKDSKCSCCDVNQNLFIANNKSVELFKSMGDANYYCKKHFIDLVKNHFEEERKKQIELPSLKSRFGHLITAKQVEKANSTCQICFEEIAEQYGYKIYNCVCTAVNHEWCILQYFKEYDFSCAQEHTTDLPDGTTDGGTVTLKRTYCSICSSRVVK